MENFLTRLQNEQSELQIKIDKLDSFISSEQFLKLNVANHILLRDQLKVMRIYNEILIIRLDLLK